jgi:hypothetical protein
VNLLCVTLSQFLHPVRATTPGICSSFQRRRFLAPRRARTPLLPSESWPRQLPSISLVMCEEGGKKDVFSPQVCTDSLFQTKDFGDDLPLVSQESVHFCITCMPHVWWGNRHSPACLIAVNSSSRNHRLSMTGDFSMFRVYVNKVPFTTLAYSHTRRHPRVCPNTYPPISHELYRKRVRDR